MTVLFFLMAIGMAGLGGYAVLVRLGLDDFEAWAGGRIAGLILVALPAWWLGIVGLNQWRIAGSVLLVGSGLYGGFVLLRRKAWRPVATAEIVFLAVAVLVLVLRLDHPAISQQEKPMDLGILATLLRAEAFPPPDMWLSGETLPYYYWGALMWTIPLSLSGLALDVGYNLVVAMAGGAVGVLLWAVGRRVGGSHWSGLMVAFFGLLAGTPDALVQIFSGTGLADINMWQSSRQIADSITEFPLFTFWHGDLHPHLLSMPVACLALLVALEAGSRGPKAKDVAVLAVLFGVCWAANPWAMPPTLTAIALLLLASDGTWIWPRGEGRARWLAVAAVALGGWLATAPFHFGFKPFFDGIGLVFAWTPPGDILLYGGCLLIPAAAAAFGLLRRELGSTEVGQAVVLTVGAAVVILASATGRPTLIFLTAVTALLTAGVLWVPPGKGRAGLALAALGVFLFLVPEVVFVKDSYGEQLHRMNTIFKSYIQGWIFLAAALPVVLRWAAPRKAYRWALIATMVAVALPHLVGLGARSLRADSWGVDGLEWMSAGDRAIVRVLRDQPPGSVVIEAVGAAYSEYSRLSAASGVPAYVGWANHELVWRGDEITPVTGRRTDLVNRLYTSGDPDAIRLMAKTAGANLIAIGSLERRDFNEDDLAAVAAAGEILVDQDDALLIRLGHE